MPHPHATVIRRFLQALVAGDMAVVDELLAEDAVLHHSGHSRFGGEHRGKEDIFRLFEATGRVLADRHIDHRVEIHDIVVGDEHTVVLWTRVARCGNESLRVNGVGVYHIDDGRIVDWWVIHEDQYAFDRFFS